MIKERISMVIPVGTDFTTEFMNELEVLNTFGLLLEDIIGEAIKVLIACAEDLEPDNIALEIDMSSLQHGYDEICGTGVSESVYGLAEDMFISGVIDFYYRLKPFVHYVMSAKFNAIVMDGYRCNSVEITHFKYIGDSIHIAADVLFGDIDEPRTISRV